jgi:hypothetical protein
MSWLGNLFGAKETAEAASTVVESVSTGITNLATGIRSAITGEMSPEKKAELEKIALEAENLQKHTQLEINLAEAQHQSPFVAGWRPFIGWVCGLSLANNYILRPWAIAVLSASGKTFEFPVIDLSLMIPIMTGMLGLAGMRTYEKKQGVTQNH